MTDATDSTRNTQRNIAPMSVRAISHQGSRLRHPERGTVASRWRPTCPQLHHPRGADKVVAALHAENWRGTRLSPETHKVDCLVIDVVDITIRHSLVTVADPVGLPPKFDFKGEDLLEVAAKFEEAKKSNQHLLMDDCQSLDEVKAKVEDVDLFIPEMPPVVREHAQLAWSQASP